jgi:hypothetical protein
LREAIAGIDPAAVGVFVLMLGLAGSDGSISLSDAALATAAACSWHGLANRTARLRAAGLIRRRKGRGSEIDPTLWRSVTR